VSAAVFESDAVPADAVVIAGLDPAIHPLTKSPKLAFAKRRDPRVEPAGDRLVGAASCALRDGCDDVDHFPAAGCAKNVFAVMGRVDTLSLPN
jgi:hypothetical protein